MFSQLLKKLTVSQIAAFTFIALIAVFFAASLFRSKPENEYRVIYENEKKRKEQKSIPVPEQFKTGLENDANVRFAERLREASALMVGLSVSEYYERLSKKRIENFNLEQVIESMRQKNLLQEIFTIQPNQPDRAITGNGVYFMRYSPKPLAFEIVAAGTNGYADGEVFVLRLPDSGTVETKQGETQTVWASLWTSPRVDSVLPKPFASENDYLNAGWKKESLKIGDAKIPN